MRKAFDPTPYLTVKETVLTAVAAACDADRYSRAIPEAAESGTFLASLTPLRADVAGVAGVAAPYGPALPWHAGLAAFLAMPCPDRRTPADWARLHRDAASFSTTWGAMAQRLGWTVTDMFGSPANPYTTAVDQLGVVPLLKGRAVVSLAADHAVIANRIGPANTFRLYPWRRPGIPMWTAYAMSSGP